MIRTKRKKLEEDVIEARTFAVMLFNELKKIEKMAKWTLIHYECTRTCLKNIVEEIEDTISPSNER